MNESYVTLQGWVGGDVDVRDVGETTCASFRVGSTPRYQRNGTWVDGKRLDGPTYLQPSQTLQLGQTRLRFIV